MLGLVRLIGIIMVAFGAVYMADPTAIRKIKSYCAKGNRIFVAGILNIVIGLAFLRAASQCIAPGFVVIVGILSVAKGITVFVIGPKKTLSLIDKLLTKPDKTLRIFGAIALVVGALIIFSA